MPKQDENKQIITELNFCVLFDRKIKGMSREEAAEKHGMSANTVDYHVSEVNRIGKVKDARQDIQDALLSLIPVAIDGLKLGLKEGEVNAINALFKGTGIYITREKQDINLHALLESTTDPEATKDALLDELIQEREAKKQQSAESDKPKTQNKE